MRGRTVFNHMKRSSINISVHFQERDKRSVLGVGGWGDNFTFREMWIMTFSKGVRRGSDCDKIIDSTPLKKITNLHIKLYFHQKFLLNAQSASTAIKYPYRMKLL